MKFEFAIEKYLFHYVRLQLNGTSPRMTAIHYPTVLFPVKYLTTRLFFSILFFNLT